MTIFEAYNDTKKQLTAAGIPDVVFEAKQIIRHITGLTNAEILTRYSEKLTAYQQSCLTVTVKQRLIRYPLQYILGEWGFYGRTFKVGPGVLVPRADTESLVDVCLRFLKDRQTPKVLDLCAGSGCVGITIACEIPSAAVTLVEKYDEAMRYLQENIKLNGGNCTAVSGDILHGDENQAGADLLVSNPPYIPEIEMAEISPETRFEPETALLCGEDELYFYRAILDNYLSCLIPGGMAAFEVGAGKAEDVGALMAQYGLKNIAYEKDLNGIYRVVFGTVQMV